MASPENRPVGGVAPRYRDFGFIVLSWFLGWGMQGVLFSWLLVNELGAPAEWVGTAHFSLVLPGLVFLLLGGALGDRVDRRRLLFWLHAIAASATFVLAGIVEADSLRFAIVIGYAVIMGTVSALAAPTRDALLSEVAGENMLRAVLGLTLIQFSAQALGASAAGLARFVGSPPTLLIQAAILLLGVVAILRLRGQPRVAAAEREPMTLSHLLAGIREVLGSPALRPVFFFTLGVGFFFQGPYWVVYPLLIRDFYGGTVDQLGMLTATFPLGTVVGSLILLRRGYLRRRGLGIAVSQSLAALCLLAIGLGVSYPLALAFGFGWGLCGAVFLNTGRTVFQERAPAAQRSRVLSVYTLGFYAAGAIGSPAAGLMAGRFGPTGAFAICGVAMILFVGIILATTDARRLE